MELRHPYQVSGDSPIPEPEAVHARQREHGVNGDGDGGEWEATELQHITDSATPRPRPPMIKRHWYDGVTRFWKHHIRMSVPHVDCRDHLANERTYLGYVRTSSAVSMLGVVVDQLYRLEKSQTPSTVFGYYVLSKPLAALLQCAALAMVLLGASRFLRQQRAMAVGKVHAGGWEIMTMGTFVGLLLIGLFAIQVGVDVYKTT